MKKKQTIHSHALLFSGVLLLSFFLFSCLINYLYQFNRSLNCFLCQFIYAHIQIHTHVVLVSNRPVSILRGDGERERCKKQHVTTDTAIVVSVFGCFSAAVFFFVGGQTKNCINAMY